MIASIIAVVLVIAGYFENNLWLTGSGIAIAVLGVRGSVLDFNKMGALVNAVVVLMGAFVLWMNQTPNYTAPKKPRQITYRSNIPAPKEPLVSAPVTPLRPSMPIDDPKRLTKCAGRTDFINVKLDQKGLYFRICGNRIKKFHIIFKPPLTKFELTYAKENKQIPNITAVDFLSPRTFKEHYFYDVIIGQYNKPKKERGVTFDITSKKFREVGIDSLIFHIKAVR